jgi:phosphoserine aminotransferase
LCSPGGIERIERIAASDRYVPASLDLAIALSNSRKDQTYNTPALATIFLMVDQIEWMLASGGLGWAASRSEESSGFLYAWAESHEVAEPFVKDPGQRSPVVGTIDFAPSVDAKELASVLRNNGIVDTEPYRKLGRNQLRVGMYPSVDPSDVAALTRCIDHVLGAMA